MNHNMRKMFTEEQISKLGGTKLYQIRRSYDVKSGQTVESGCQTHFEFEIISHDKALAVAIPLHKTFVTMYQVFCLHAINTNGGNLITKVVTDSTTPDINKHLFITVMNIQGVETVYELDKMSKYDISTSLTEIK